MQAIRSSSTVTALDLRPPSPTRSKQPDARKLYQYGLDPVAHIPVRKKRGFFSVISRAFDKVDDLYDKHVPYGLRKKIRLIKKTGGKAAELFGRILNFAMPLLSMGRNTARTALKAGSKFAKAAVKIKVVSAITVGGVLYEMAMNVQRLTKYIFKHDFSYVVDSGLMIIDNISDLVGIAEDLLSGLMEFGAVAATSALQLAANILFGVGTFLSIASIALNSKHWYHSSQFRKNMNNAYEEGSFESVVSFLRERKNRSLKDRLGVPHGGAFKVRMEVIFEKYGKSDDPEAKKNIDKAMRTMKMRLVTKEVSHGLRILSGTISIVACGIMLFTPFTPVGFGLLAVASAIGIAALITDHVAQHIFDKRMNELAPDKLEMPEEPKKPVLADPNNVKAQKMHSKAMKKYEEDMVKYEAALKKYHFDLKYSKPLIQYKWQKYGKKAKRKRVANIIEWKPAVKSSEPKLQDDPFKVDKKVVENFFSEKVEKLSADKLRKIEKEEGGMTFEQIKNWKPKSQIAA